VTRASHRRSRTAARHGAPQLRLGAWTERELVVDLFAGGGGASEGIARALGRHPDIAVNHDPAAIAMHRANHPTTIHFCESVFKVTPREAVGGRPIGLLWASPDCTHFSKSKGGKPRSKKIRGLAWVVVRWAKEAAPRVIALENVEEFADWGPLKSDDKPDEARAGQTFRAFVRKLERYGYRVEHRVLVAADYGAPTTRKRLFLVARRDGASIAWPAPTHAETPRRGLRAWRTAGEVIDWSIPMRSVFTREKGLVDNTMRRIARGIVKYVLDVPRPFLVHSGNGERVGQEPRTYSLARPLGTVVAGGVKHRLVAAFLTKNYGSPPYPKPLKSVGQSLDEPVGTITTQDHHHLAAVSLECGTDHGDDVAALLMRWEGIAPPSIVVDGAPHRIFDIVTRMLVPRELARAQGFGDAYVLDPVFNGRPLPATEQTAKVGNSVSPNQAEAVVRANFAERASEAA
jgi:DNA (cytosine-5)-methyltransferase 1